MEIPKYLQVLYRHWDRHTVFLHQRSVTQINKDMYNEMVSFAIERMHIWAKKTSGGNAPYTDDPILRDYKFCNIYRELDRQTIEFHTMLKDVRDNFPLWLLNMMFCRFVCRPETIRHVGFLTFDETANQDVLRRLCEMPRPKFGDAYIFPISIIQHSLYESREKFFCFYLPQKAKELALCIKHHNDAAILSLLPQLTEILGYNFRFHLTEVLIDVAYQYPKHINLFRDFPIGPGSIPTMRLLNRNADPVDVCKALVTTQPTKFPNLMYKGKPVLLSAENWEGIGCEFRKYRNLQSGVGRKRRYHK